MKRNFYITLERGDASIRRHISFDTTDIYDQGIGAVVRQMGRRITGDVLSDEQIGEIIDGVGDVNWPPRRNKWADAQ